MTIIKKWQHLILITLCAGMLSIPVYGTPLSVSVGECSQFDSRFPDKNPTECLLAQNRRVFKGYHGQGTLVVTNHGASFADVYVNGHRLPLKQAFNQPDSTETIAMGSYVHDGYNTFKILNIKPAGTGIDAKISYPEITLGTPEQAGFSSKKLGQIDTLIESDVKKGFPGAVLLVLKDGKIIKERAYGWAKLYDERNLLPVKQRQKMTVDTMFDLSSNTKMYATIFACMKLTDEGKLDPEELVSKYIPGFTGDGREKICVRDIMTHSAGFSSEIQFFKPQAGRFYSLDRHKTMSLLEKAPLAYPTGTQTIYSDTDYMILGMIVENITKQRLDTYVEQQIYRPLGLLHTLFNPLKKGYAASEFAATEPCGNTRSGMVFFPEIRTHTLQGEVQDEKSWYSMGGVSGHAGLFSRAADLAVLAQVMLNKGGYGSYRLCRPQIITYYTKPTDRNPKFGLGWNKGSMSDRVWEFGPYAGDEAFAHTGWNGTDICIDPKYDLAVIFLTNRVHEPNIPGQPNTFITDDFKTIQYGSILSLVYESFLEQ